jgi:hypothetical protein
VTACPWSDYTPASIAFCERRLCALVVEPSNAWSNLGYVLVGLYLLSRARGRGPLLAVGVAGVLIGLGSFAFHATGVRVGELLDVTAMYLFGALGVVFSLRRLRPVPDGMLIAFYTALVTGSALFMAATGSNGILVFTAQIVFTVVAELYLAVRRHGATAYRYLRWTVGAFALAFLIWNLDKWGVVCDPDNHLVTGHAVWHVLTAVALLFFYSYQEQFFVRQPGGAASSLRSGSALPSRRRDRA